MRSSVSALYIVMQRAPMCWCPEQRTISKSCNCGQPASTSVSYAWPHRSTEAVSAGSHTGLPATHNTPGPAHRLPPALQGDSVGFSVHLTCHSELTPASVTHTQPPKTCQQIIQPNPAPTHPHRHSSCQAASPCKRRAARLQVSGVGAHGLQDLVLDLTARHVVPNKVHGARLMHARAQRPAAERGAAISTTIHVAQTCRSTAHRSCPQARAHSMQGRPCAGRCTTAMACKPCGVLPSSLT